MNQDWNNFLTSQGAQIQDGVVSHFDDAAAERLATRDSTVLCDLGQFGTLRASGEESESFLQNLLSNDIREVGNAAQAQLSSLNSPKGRMLATLLIWRQGDDYLLQLPRVLCEPIRKKLSMYVLRAKVKIADASDEIVTMGLSGADGQEILRARFGELPESPLGVVSNESGSVIKLSDSRWQINATPQHARLLWTEFKSRARPVGSGCWDWLHIRSGIPVILPQTQEQFVAQMANFDLVNGVNFKKGCYPGQEIVARTQYLGKLKRRMYLAHIHSSEAPQPGDELFSADMEGQASGMLANVAAAPSGGYDVLAVMPTASRETLPVHWKSPLGAELQFLPLPYMLPAN